MGIFRNIANVLRVRDLAALGENDENRSPICDADGAIWVRPSNEISGGFSANSWAWQRFFGVTNGSVTITSDVALVRHILAISGDPAVAFSAAPVYFQIHAAALTPAAVPLFTFPVPPPPLMLDLALEDSYLSTFVGLPYNWGFSSTRDTYTAGPTGNVHLNVAQTVTY